MILKLTNNKNTYSFEVEDMNNGEKLFYHFQIPTADMEDGKYNMILLDGDEIVAEEQVCIGAYNPQTIQYSRGENVYINAPFEANLEDVKEVEITAINTTVLPSEGYDGIKAVEVNAQPIYNEGYNEGENIGYNSGYTAGDIDGYNRGYNEGEIDQKAKLSAITITENGTYSREDGYNEITVDVIDLNGDYNEGYDAGKIDGYDSGYTAGENEQKSKLSSISIKNNGTYRNDNGYSEVIVEVGNEQANYGYKTNWVDEDGLREIGWNDEDIALFKNNISHYQWENYKYVVSDENKALYNELTADNIDQHKDDPNLVFMPKSSQITNLGGFKYLKGIPYLDVTQYDMGFLLNNNPSLKTIPLFDFSNRTNINYLFDSSSSLESLPMLDFSDVQTAAAAFSNTTIETIPQYNFENCERCAQMFQGCTALKTLPDLNIKSATETTQMFHKCSNLKEVSPMDLSNVGDASWMFADCGSIEKIPYLNLSKAESLSHLFYNCGSLKEVEGLDTDSATNVDYLFYGCVNLTTIPILNFENVTSINYFFGYSTIHTLTEWSFYNLKTNWNSNGLDRCPNLTYQSCINILNGLADVTELGGRKLKVHQNFLDTVGDEISIGVLKGWSISA